MLERLVYKNHINETLDFGSFPMFVNENDLRDFAWEITSKNDRISAFKKGIVSKTIPVILKCKDEADGYDMRNRIFEIFEKDVLAQKHGQIFIGDYYLKCYITGSKKTEYLLQKGYMSIDLSVQTDFPQWVKETTTVYSRFSGSTAHFLDYNFDYDFDYVSTLPNGIINNNSFVASNFRIIIYGYVSNPTLYIAGHQYSVYVNIEDGEYLTIDSVEKTIILTKKDGVQVNCFNKREKDSYIFEKIPAGENVFTTPHGDLYMSITILDERSEPKWT